MAIIEFSSPNILSLSCRKIAVFHEPEPIEEFLLQNQKIDVILHGHTHRYRNETKNGILYFNPGESAGMLKGRNAVGIVDLDTLEARRIFF